jgi:polysaccharide export outer membrane protein
MAAQAPASGTKPVGGAASDDEDYVIGPQDVLFVEVWGSQPLSRQALVRPDGRISVGLVGELMAAGLTPAALGRQIEEKLKEGKFLLTPRVAVSVLQINSKKFYINGEVLKPGEYNLVVPMRVMEALVNAGGFRDFANQKNIQIHRGTKRFKFNYKEVAEGKKLDQNIWLEPGDIIIVK